MALSIVPSCALAPAIDTSKTYEHLTADFNAQNLGGAQKAIAWLRRSSASRLTQRCNSRNFMRRLTKLPLVDETLSRSPAVLSQ